MVEMKRPRVGVAVCINKEKYILLGRRIGSHGDGTWSFPGGNLEPGETIIGCAVREVAEETGMEIVKPKIVTITEDFFLDKGLHYITVFVRADAADSRYPQLLEPKKCASWRWFMPYDLPKPLFQPIENLMKEDNALMRLCR